MAQQTMTVEILPEAKRDIWDAADFWEEKEVGLGSEFLEFFLPQIDKLKRTGGTHPRTGEYHRAVILGKFPYYCAYYKLRGDFVEVFAVIDARRNPTWIRQVLQRRIG